MSSDSGTTPVTYKAIYSDNHAGPEGGEFVVVKTTYPTTYGCNRGEVFSQRRMMMESSILPIGPSGEEAEPGVGTGFAELEDAIRFAKELRDGNEWFTDYAHSHPEAANAGYKWDSAEMKNYDNDEEVRIEVMTKTDFAITMEMNMRIMMGGP